MLGEGRVLAEQLALLLQNVKKVAWLRWALLALLLGSLGTRDNARSLVLWAAATGASKQWQSLYARRALARAIEARDAARLIWSLSLAQVVDGALWGCLPWLVLDSASVPASVMVLSILSVVTSNAMSVLSPVPPVFAAFAVSLASVLVAKLHQVGDPAYLGLIAATFMYVGALLFVARNGAQTSQASIALRFENLGLVNRWRDAQRAAEAANLAKSKFLAAASHDLRQPVHSQGLFLDVLSRTALSAHQREVLGHVRSLTDATREMLNTLLDFARLEAGVVEPNVVPFRVQPLLSRLEREFAPQAVAKGLVFRVRETKRAALLDPSLVELVARNLLSNAIRYTHRGGVLLACRARGAHLWLEVWDTGVGIAPDQHEEIFREFHQLGNPERDRRKGLGLGLAIAEGLARTMRSRLWLTSTPGRGSVFRLEMPTASEAALSEAEAPEARPGQLAGKRVLVIDDDEAVRAGMSLLLVHWGCLCTTVESIEEALAASRAETPDVIVSDYRLREKRTGAEAIAAVRAQCGLTSLPAVLITGDTSPERLREAGACHLPLLHKPVSAEQLYRSLVDTLPR